jgi:hypothetical protein
MAKQDVSSAEETPHPVITILRFRRDFVTRKNTGFSVPGKYCKNGMLSGSGGEGQRQEGILVITRRPALSLPPDCEPTTRQ